MSTSTQQDYNPRATVYVFTVKPNGDVWKNNQPSICAFAPAIPLPSKIQGGGFEMLRMPCTVKCPNCSIMKGAISEEDQKQSVDLPFLQITCGGYPIAQYANIEKEEGERKGTVMSMLKEN